MTKAGMLSAIVELENYLTWANEAIEKEDWNEAESNLSMLCDDAGTLYNEVEKLSR
jgi:hypothetical protein